MTLKTVRTALLEYAEEKYHTQPDYPWSRFPQTIVLRHAGSRKWYALITSVSRHKLGLDSDSDVDIINIKCPSELTGSLRQSTGYLPAWHMNKEHWITVLLDGSVPITEIQHFIDQSFLLTV